MDIFWVVTVVTISGLVVFGLQILAIRSFTRRGREPTGTEDETEFRPPISILKPLHGLDDHLFGNLESFCLQDYPFYELLCSFKDHNDPAYRVAQTIKNKFPNRRISLIVEGYDAGLNPKVNRLHPAYQRAQYPYLLISDSNVMVPPDYLKQIIRPMKDPQTGLVTNLIRGMGARTIGSLFENLHLNSFILGNVCFLKRFLDIPCVIGKSMLLRRDDLEAIGGFRAVKDVLAEDHFIGERIRKRGQKVILSSFMVNNVNEYWGFKKFLNRHVRWGKMRWKILRYKYILELVTNPVLVSFTSWIVEGPSRRALILIASVGFIKGVGDYYVGKKIGAHIHPLGYLLSPMKDLLIGLIWFLSIANDTVVWRGKRYLIRENTVLCPCPEKGIWTWRYRLMDWVRASVAW